MATAGSRVTPDTDLVPRCRAGDSQAWHELVTAYERLVYSVPRSYGLDREDAEDVTQATFAALLSGLRSLRDDQALLPWLGTVARRQTWRVIDRRRREREVLAREHPDRAGTDPAAGVSDPVDAYEEWTQRAWLHQGLTRLDPDCRRLLRALYLDDADPSYQAIAARLGKAVGTIGPARARCLHRLRSAMEDE
ncbi:MAG: sigma-70 family RNA polymerase sigma factor [Nocardioidaceae bacterium]|nr:sigma-70 family RNA polymerase sigma factor [Nocardioidaceae bacterium]